ncbi:hypothetical protein ACIQMV_39010 [Streptomyces sp. NPDC091412]|uniref:hypothetical protein n=1 Tax=Streptomyces sp. NPDC091412 TaxID=3366002 RepID=UPI0037F14120
MTADTDLDALLAVLPKPTPREALAELFAARRADEASQLEQTIVPEPVLPPLWPHPRSGIVRYPCALSCGWAHVEDVFLNDLENSRRLVIPVGNQEETTRAITAHANARAEEQRKRIEGAIRAHFEESHQGQEPPTWAVRRGA